MKRQMTQKELWGIQKRSFTMTDDKWLSLAILGFSLFVALIGWLIA